MSKQEKPILRGHFHQAAFFYSLGICTLLILQAPTKKAAISAIIYSVSLCGLFGISALYHRPQWGQNARQWLRRIDHAAIYILIAGSATPICLMALDPEIGQKILWMIWPAASLGILQSLFWIKAPKWIATIFYLLVGFTVVPYLPELYNALGMTKVALILIGGLSYILGALVYAFKFPNPSPKYFGYHEIFHILVIVASAFHFYVIFGVVV
jgi:hemolysin III